MADKPTINLAADSFTTSPIKTDSHTVVSINITPSSWGSVIATQTQFAVVELQWTLDDDQDNWFSFTPRMMLSTTHPGVRAHPIQGTKMLRLKVITAASAADDDADFDMIVYRDTPRVPLRSYRTLWGDDTRSELSPGGASTPYGDYYPAPGEIAFVEQVIIHNDGTAPASEDYQLSIQTPDNSNLLLSNDQALAADASITIALKLGLDGNGQYNTTAFFNYPHTPGIRVLSSDGTPDMNHAFVGWVEW